MHNYSRYENNNNGDMMEKQKITCEVFDCKHCNCDEYMCNLKEIKVRNCSDDETKEATMCYSYAKRKK